ncbi:MAG: hypothetical protein Fur0014_15870 [Rubrivivax sp.]
MNDASLTELLDEAYRCAMGGELERARQAVAAARQWRPVAKGSAESMEVMLVEGVVHTYCGETDAARDRFRRVIALGPLVPQSEAPLQAWAWQALLDYNQGQVLAAAESLARACAQPERAGPRTRMRASVNAALLCEYSGQRTAAKSWVAAARRAAPDCGVPGLTSLVVYGLAAVRVTEAAVDNLRSKVAPSNASALLMQVQSAINYDTAVGVVAQPTLHLLVQAMALRLADRPTEAIPLLEEFVATDRLTAETDRLSARVELIACQLQADPHFHSAASAEWLERSARSLVDPGERAHAYLLLNELCMRAKVVPSEDWAAKASLELSQHDTRRSALAGRLGELGLTTVPQPWAVPATAVSNR